MKLLQKPFEIILHVPKKFLKNNCVKLGILSIYNPKLKILKISKGSITVRELYFWEKFLMWVFEK